MDAISDISFMHRFLIAEEETEENYQNRQAWLNSLDDVSEFVNVFPDEDDFWNNDDLF